MKVCVATVLLAFAACQGLGRGAPEPTTSASELFSGIEIGMPRTEVEARLGAPIQQFSANLPPRLSEHRAWYLPAPELEPWESPWAPGAIGVDYTTDDRVAAKVLHPQCRTR